jgi:hypothetical protein
MGLFFSKPKQQTDNIHHAQHPQRPIHRSMVTYDFDTLRGQMRAVKEAEGRMKKEKVKLIKIKTAQ